MFDNTPIIRTCAYMRWAYKLSISIIVTLTLNHITLYYIISILGYNYIITDWYGYKWETLYIIKCERTFTT